MAKWAAAGQGRGAAARARRTAHAGAGAQAGRLRARTGAGAARPRRDDDRGVRLLLDGLRPGDPPRNGEAINLSPSRDYPVNRGTACPKGWEALTPLAAPDRATHPLIRNAAGKLEPASWGAAIDAMVRRFRAIGDSTARSRSRSWEPARCRARSWLSSARSRSSGWAWCTATATRASAWRPRSSPTSRRSASTPRPTPTPTSRNRTRWCSSGRTLHRPPDHVGARLQEPAQARDRRHRSAQDGDGGRGDAAPGGAAEVGPEAVLRHREPADHARLDRPRLHRAAHERLRGVRGGGRAVHAGGDGRGHGPARRGDREAGRPRSTSASACRSGGRWA